MRRVLLLCGWLPLLGACTEAPGVCAESIRVESVRFGWCYEVEGPGECPTFWSVNEPGETVWDFHEGSTCPEHGYTFNCGEGIWEDIATDCPSGEAIEEVIPEDTTGTSTGGSTGTGTTGTTG